ncbi:MAG: PadR family transcriptional regulator [Bryobacterales bacterium]
MPQTTPNDRRDLFPGALEMMILRVLQREPMHGYALAQRIKAASEELLQVEEGSLYPALQRMLKENWVQAAWGVSSTNRRVRVYTVTKAGSDRLAAEITRFERMLKGIQLVLNAELV